jgi:hypothetical protein
MQAELDWQSELLEQGFTRVPGILKKKQCEALISNYDENIYRSTINMQRYNFGRGEYKYFAYPLPDLITSLRQSFYKSLLPVAKAWADRLKIAADFPKTHDDYIKHCHSNGQLRPTPLILKYKEGDYNTLHQDLYGNIHFPYQAAIMLSDPAGYAGGEFTLIEQRPRMQSVAHLQQLMQGEAIIFAVNEFPKLGKCGYYRAKLRHGVSVLRSGSRYTLGIILHDAR